MTEQENKRDLDKRDWINRHGVKFLQAVLWELGLDEEPEETLTEVLEIVHQRTELYVFDSESARSYVNYCNYINGFCDEQMAHDRVRNANASASARQGRIKARRKSKLKAMDCEDSLL